ncbi:hypothetical protein ANANG_G00290500 [Anguilla anguilla]|uniref:Ig-like domain-containing protein n=1 Tax=Anguilla anguilla TaxID=7936 RepID=A0A9D3LTE5_ANGAN|nr:hypothetical protein ANANG_G00290500 [Anguilla anguilla]
MSQPTLSLSSPHSVLSSGEEVRFRCVAPADLCAPVEFRLHRGGAGSPLARKSESRGTSVEMGVNNVDSSHQGSYTCLYAVQGSQTVHSSHSNSIAISVVVLQQPAIVFSSPTGEVTGGPQGPEVIEGHSFTITCSTVPQYTGGSFYLSFTGSSVTEAQAAVSHSAAFIFSAAELSHQGNYSCVYETTVSGRKFSSPASPLLPLTVTVVLQQPAIVLSSPTGEVTGGPQGPEVIEGHSFTITCSTVPQYPGGSFHLSFTGSNLTEAQAAVNHSTSFLFSAAELSHQGNYSCVYETTVSGRKFSSPASPLLPLTVTASLILPIALGVSGGLLLVLVPLVLFLLFWKRRHSSGRTQVAKTASNARPMNPYFPKGKASEEEDEQDYENAETLTGNDYEDGIGDEDSGSEADYVNYSDPTENKYSEDENIYQNS